jgi:hypothetical protein
VSVKDVPERFVKDVTVLDTFRPAVSYKKMAASAAEVKPELLFM